MSVLKPNVGPADQRTGNRKSPVTLVEYGDFECPHCGHAHPLLKRLLNEIGDSFQLVFRNFPLQEAHPHAHIAALAAEAAGKQGKYWEMHDLIYENQERLDSYLLLDLANSLGLELHQFGADWKSQEVSDKVENDFESGVRSGVNGTPSFFLNGKLWRGYDGSYESLLNGIRDAARTVA